MKKLDRWSGVSRAFIAGLLLALLGACAATPPAPEAAPEVSASRAQRGTDWREEIIYFALTDRFANGNPRNDDGAPGPEGDAEPENPLAWHGGDFAGISQKIREGYFQKLGFTAIWISPVVLQVPAIPVADGPNQGEMFAGYHGYWAEGFVTVDPHFGTLKELKQLVRLAHSRGLKIIQDVVVNHAGYGAALVTEKPAWLNDEVDCANTYEHRPGLPAGGPTRLRPGPPRGGGFPQRFCELLGYGGRHRRHPNGHRQAC